MGFVIAYYIKKKISDKNLSCIRLTIVQLNDVLYIR